MADINQLPEHLQEHAKAMPADLVTRMGQAELDYRLTHYHALMRDADSMPNPALYRQLNAHARKVCVTP